MSGSERERLHVIRRVAGREMKQARGAELLGVTVRHLKRLVRGYRARGDRSLISQQRGRPSNNRLKAETVRRIELALRERYADFGATLAAEKLAGIEGIAVSVEAVRQIQIRLGLWRPKRRRQKRVFQVRERRPRFGELIQIDGSPHAWGSHATAPVRSHSSPIRPRPRVPDHRPKKGTFLLCTKGTFQLGANKRESKRCPPPLNRLRQTAQHP
jgi:transposase